MSSLAGKVALVTGASRGLGEGAARALAAHGARVMLVARDGARAAAVAASIGDAARAEACDVAEWRAVEATVARTRAAFGRIDFLVNNAGVIEPIAALAEGDPAAWAHSIQVNLVGAYHVLRAVLPGMAAAGAGTVINVSSGAAHRPLEGWSAYCAGKAGLAMVTRAATLEYAAQGLRIFGFSPGTIDTDMQVKIRASGINAISRIPRAELSPVAHAVAGLLALCGPGTDDLIGQDVSMRDEAFRSRLALG